MRLVISGVGGARCAAAEERVVRAGGVLAREGSAMAWYG